MWRSPCCFVLCLICARILASTTDEIITSFQLPSEKHEIVSEDGYIQTVFRIPKPGATPILFFHGFLCSSDAWLLLPKREQNIATILYDEGFDIWLLNARGNEYARNHVSMSPDRTNEKFWDFSVHEIGTKDLPATVDYILDVTKKKYVLYVGHSMGTTILSVACSEVPEMNTKIKTAVLLAPVVFPTTSKKVPFVKMIINSADFWKNLLDSVNNYELLGQNSLKNTLINLFCNLDLSLCANFYAVTFQQNLTNINIDRMPYYLVKYTAGTSVKLYHHIAKNVASDGNFKKSDHGPERNLAIYGSRTPPEYDMEKVTLPLALFYSQNDAFVDDENLKKMRSTFKNIIFEYEVPDPSFQHVDYYHGLNSKDLVAKQIVKIFKKYSINNKNL